MARVVLGALVVLAASAELAASATGHIIRRIAAALRIGTELPRTDLGAARAVIRLPNAKAVPDNKFPGRVAT